MLDCEAKKKITGVHDSFGTLTSVDFSPEPKVEYHCSLISISALLNENSKCNKSVT